MPSSLRTINNVWRGRKRRETTSSFLTSFSLSCASNSRGFGCPYLFSSKIVRRNGARFMRVDTFSPVASIRNFFTSETQTSRYWKYRNTCYYVAALKYTLKRILEIAGPDLMTPSIRGKPDANRDGPIQRTTLPTCSIQS